MNIGEGIVEACRATAGKNAKFFWDWACANGWKNPHGNGGGGGWLAWCAVAASYRVWEGTQGAVTLAFGQPKKLSVSRFALGNASVWRIWEDAQRLGLLTNEPKPGMLCLVEVRGKDKPWPGRPGHIGIVTTLRFDGDKVVGVRSREGNYGGKDVEPYRSLDKKSTGRERVFCFVDLEKYAQNIGVVAGDTDCDDGDDVCSLSEQVMFEGEDYEVMMPDDRFVRCRVVGLGEDAIPLLQEVKDNGEVVMDAPVMSASLCVVIGPWE